MCPQKVALGIPSAMGICLFLVFPLLRSLERIPLLKIQHPSLIFDFETRVGLTFVYEER